jgi:hypothetical protein
MRLRVPAGLPVAPVRAGAVRIRCAPTHRIHRRARIHYFAVTGESYAWRGDNGVLWWL